MVVAAKGQSDSVFIYSPNERGGLRVAEQEGSSWKDLGQLCSSDYGTWGAEKPTTLPPYSLRVIEL